LQAAQRALTIFAGGKPFYCSIALGERADQGGAMRDRFVARHLRCADNSPRGRNFHKNSPYKIIQLFSFGDKKKKPV
jgi:hypothetical protein